MAQMTGAISPKAMKVEYSANGVTWTDMSGYAANVEPGGGERKSGEAYTYDGETPIVTFAKMNAAEVKIKAVYTKAVNAPFDFFRDALADDDSMYVRWSPEGGAVNDKLFTLYGHVTDCKPVAGASDDANPILFSATVKGCAITDSLVVAP